MKTTKLSSIFGLALMAVAAIAMTSCTDKGNNPENPNTPSNKEEKIYTVPVVMAVGVTEQFLKIADFAIIDSLNGAAGKEEKLVPIYTDCTQAAIVGITTGYFWSEKSGDAITLQGIYLKQTLKTGDRLGVRCQLRIKENALDIISKMDPSTDLVLGGYRANCAEKDAPHMSAFMASSTFGVGDLQKKIESEPETITKLLNTQAERAVRTMDGTFYLLEGIISTEL